MYFSDTAINLTLKTTIQVDADDYIVVSDGGHEAVSDKQFSIPLLNAESFRVEDELYFEGLGAFIATVFTRLLTVNESERNRKVTVEYTAVESGE